MIIKNKNFYVFHIIPRIPRRTSFKSKTPWKILIVEGNGQKGPGSPSKISFGPFKKFFAQLAVLLRGERAFSRITFVELSYRKSGGGSAIFVQLGCIHHRPLCISKSKLSTTTFTSRRERNEKRGSRYFVYMPCFLCLLCKIDLHF